MMRFAASLGHRGARGFTLVEILMVVAIIGILASVAVPSYQRYVYRAEAAELVLKFDRIRGALAELQATTGMKVDGKANSIRVLTETARSGSGGLPQARRVVWCQLASSGACGRGVGLGDVPGISASELASPRHDITLSVWTPFFTPVPASYEIHIEFNPANPHGVQVAHALADVMKPHAVRTSVSSRVISMSFLL